MITTRLITHSLLLYSMPYYQLAKAQSYGQESLVTFQASVMPATNGEGDGHDTGLAKCIIFFWSGE